MSARHRTLHPDDAVAALREDDAWQIALHQGRERRSVEGRGPLVPEPRRTTTWVILAGQVG